MYGFIGNYVYLNLSYTSNVHLSDLLPLRVALGSLCPDGALRGFQFCAPQEGKRVTFSESFLLMASSALLLGPVLAPRGPVGLPPPPSSFPQTTRPGPA